MEIEICNGTVEHPLGRTVRPAAARAPDLARRLPRHQEDAGGASEPGLCQVQGVGQAADRQGK